MFQINLNPNVDDKLQIRKNNDKNQSKIIPNKRHVQLNT